MAVRALKFENLLGVRFLMEYNQETITNSFTKSRGVRGMLPQKVMKIKCSRLAEIAFPYILSYETNINLTTLFSV